jgi:acetyl esterase/lipase
MNFLFRIIPWILGFLSVSAHAEQRVLFKPVNLTSGVAVRSESFSSATNKVWNFSDSTALFAGTSATGTKIYGGMSAAVTAGPITNAPAISVQSDQLVVSAYGAAGYVGTIKGLLLWDKNDFISGSASTLRFDDTTNSFLSTIMFRNYGTARWVIRNGSTYYVSDATFTGTTTSALTGTNNVQWASWDPTANGGADFANIPVSGFTSRTFSNVTAVGVFYTQSRGVNQAPLFTMSDGGFAANLVVEPDVPVSTNVVTFIYNGGNSNFARTKSTDADDQSAWDFSETVPFGGALAASGNSNTEVYGGLSITWATAAPATPVARYCNAVTGVYTGGLQVISSAGDTFNAAKGLYVWRKSDFLKAASRFEMTTNDVLTATYATQASSGKCEVRFAVKNGSTWLVSETAWTGAQTQTAALTNPAAINWAMIDTSNYSFGGFFPVSLSDIRGIGLYFSVQNDGEFKWGQMRLAHLNVTATPAFGDAPPSQMTTAPVEVYGATNLVTVNLASRFFDPEGSTLQFVITGNSNTGLVPSASVDGQQLALTLTAGLEGSADITIRAEDAASNICSGPVKVTVKRTGLIAWRYNNFTSTAVTNSSLESSVWGDQADPDGDGIPNLLEYALALDPWQPDSGLPGVLIAGAGAAAQVTYRKAVQLATEPDIGMHLLAATNLAGNANWFVLNEKETSLGTADGFESIRKTLPPEYTRLFIKTALRKADPVSDWAAGQMAAYNCRTNIFYKMVNGKWLGMFLIMPTVQKYERAPVMLYTHGGGWGGGDPFSVFGPNFAEALKILSSNGIACAAIEYRLTELGVSTAYDCVVDCKDAARFLVKNAADLGIDPDRIGIWGSSAGGHLSLMTGLAPEADFPGAPELAGIEPGFRCIASYFPATTFLVPEVLVGSNFESPSRFVSFLGGSYEENMDLVALLSPTEHLTAASPPVLLLHGDKDQVLPYTNSTYMIGVAEDVGANVQLLTVTNGLHGFAPFDASGIQPTMSEINRTAAEFIIKNLSE